MRTLALAALAPLALALSACGGGGETAANDAAFADDNMLMDENLLLDSNAMNGMGGVDANMSANTANMMATDAVTNDADTNLANGL